MNSNILSHFSNLCLVSGENNWKCTCPAHADSSPSLSIKLNDKGNYVLHCFGGCSTSSILKAVGLSMSDLFEKPLENKSAPPRRRIERTYDYRDATGKLLYQNVRMVPKMFFHRAPDGNGGWMKDERGKHTVKGVEKVIYRLPEVLSAVSNKKTVYIMGGEKDALNLIDWGFEATCCSGGEESWRDSFGDWFVGANVVIVPHNDRAGRKYADKVAMSMVGKAKRISILALPVKNAKEDFSDWKQSGGTKDEFVELAIQSEKWEPSLPMGLFHDLKAFLPQGVELTQDAELRGLETVSESQVVKLIDDFGRHSKTVQVTVKFLTGDMYNSLPKETRFALI